MKRKNAHKVLLTLGKVWFHVRDHPHWGEELKDQVNKSMEILSQEISESEEE